MTNCPANIFVDDRPIEHIGTITINLNIGSASTVTWQELAISNGRHRHFSKVEVFTLNGRKLFLGNILDFKLEVKPEGVIWTYSAQDYYRMLKRRIIKREYVFESVNSIILDLINRGGGTPFLTPVVYQLGTRPDPNLLLGDIPIQNIFIDFNVENQYLEDALNLLSNQLNIGYRVSATTGKLVFYEIGEGLPAPAILDDPIAALCDFCGDVDNFSYTEQSPEVSRVFTLGKRGDLSLPDQMTRVPTTGERLAPGEIKRYFPLLEEICKVRQVEILEDAPAPPDPVLYNYVVRQWILGDVCRDAFTTPVVTDGIVARTLSSQRSGIEFFSCLAVHPTTGDIYYTGGGAGFGRPENRQVWRISGGRVFLVAGSGAPARNRVSDTVASLNLGGDPKNAVLGGPCGLEIDSNGDIYIGDAAYSVIFKIDGSSGNINLYAGQFPTPAIIPEPNDGDNVTTNPILIDAGGLAIDGGFLYYVNGSFTAIKRINLSTNQVFNVIGDVANARNVVPVQDGIDFNVPPSSSVLLLDVIGIDFDAEGNLYWNEIALVRRINKATNLVEIVCGTGESPDVVNEAQLAAEEGADPLTVKCGSSSVLYGVAVNRNSGEVFYSDGFFLNTRVIRDGLLYSFAGRAINTFVAGYGDGNPPLETFAIFPNNLEWNPQIGEVLLMDSGFISAVRNIPVPPSYFIGTFAGTGVGGFSGDGGLSTSAQLNFPQAPHYGSDGFVYIADGGNGRIRQVNLSTGDITTIVSGLTFPFDLQADANGDLYIANGNGGNVLFFEKSTSSLSVLVSGFVFVSDVKRLDADNLLIVDADGHRIFQYTQSTSTLIPYAGAGVNGFLDGSRLTAQFSFPLRICLDLTRDAIYVVDNGNHRIRVINPVTNTVTTLLGNGEGFANCGNSYALSLGLTDMSFPRGVACDTATGDIIFSEGGGGVVRMVQSASNTPFHIAGDGDIGFDGDGGKARLADLAFPQGVAVLPDGRILIADIDNHRIRVLNP